MMKYIGVVIISAILSGCVGPLVPVTAVDERTSEALAAVTPIYAPGAAPKNAAVLGPIHAVSCKNKMWDPPPTRENAIAQLRVFSRSRGGDAVGEMACGEIEPTSLVKNCWSSITCDGVALKLKQ